MNNDKQLRTVNVKEVFAKRNRDQALNAKEFAVLAGIGYSKALEWFRKPGFPACDGVVFWTDFIAWRRRQSLPIGPAPTMNPRALEWQASA
jgi:hypothetical protein